MTSLDQKTNLWIVLAGAMVGLVGFAITMTSENLVGSIVTLIGAMILLAGSVMLFVASKDAKPKLPNSVEEQRQIIRSMADDIKQESDS